MQHTQYVYDNEGAKQRAKPKEFFDYIFSPTERTNDSIACGRFSFSFKCRHRAADIMRTDGWVPHCVVSPLWRNANVKPTISSKFNVYLFFFCFFFKECTEIIHGVIERQDNKIFSLYIEKKRIFLLFISGKTVNKDTISNFLFYFLKPWKIDTSQQKENWYFS